MAPFQSELRSGNVGRSARSVRAVTCDAMVAGRRREATRVGTTRRDAEHDGHDSLAQGMASRTSVIPRFLWRLQIRRRPLEIVLRGMRETDYLPQQEQDDQTQSQGGWVLECTHEVSLLEYLLTCN